MNEIPIGSLSSTLPLVQVNRFRPEVQEGQVHLPETNKKTEQLMSLTTEAFFYETLPFLVVRVALDRLLAPVDPVGPSGQVHLIHPALLGPLSLPAVRVLQSLPLVLQITKYKNRSNNCFPHRIPISPGFPGIPAGPWIQTKRQLILVYVNLNAFNGFLMDTSDLPLGSQCQLVDFPSHTHSLRIDSVYCFFPSPIHTMQLPIAGPF